MEKCDTTTNEKQHRNLNKQISNQLCSQTDNGVAVCEQKLSSKFFKGLNNNICIMEANVKLQIFLFLLLHTTCF